MVGMAAHPASHDFAATGFIQIAIRSLHDGLAAAVAVHPYPLVREEMPVLRLQFA